ncbi:MAG TPA: hypothetical protein VL981_11690 [Candidatus Methylacidiphilales bacterium]|nr:hypothetical protein [Candidatus Methylacidiphilales bacterium]
MNELRLTDTNAADDSAGSVWGLDGSLFMPVVASAAISIGVILILFSFFHLVWWMSFPLGAVPFTFTLIYVLLFRQGKPPGYDRDLFELWIIGPGFSFSPADGGKYRKPDFTRDTK